MENTANQAGHRPGGNGTSTGITAEAPRARSAVEPPSRPPRARKGIVWQAMARVAALRITVVLFAMSLLLVFWGTLAQVDKGVWTVVAEYFRSPMVWVPMNIVCIKPILHFESNIRGSIPYPGGWLLGGLLLANLLAAHAVTFRLSWKRSGIIIIHAGIIVMMLGELITGLWAVEGHMTIAQGGTSNFVYHAHAPELAIVDASDLKKDQVVVVPTARLRRGGLIQDPQLPFDVEVVQYMVNCQILDAKQGAENRATRGQGLHLIAEPRAEGTGVDTDSKIDVAACYLTFKRKSKDESFGTYMFFLDVDMRFAETVEVDGKVCQVSLRPKRVYYKDLTFRLDKLDAIMWPNSNKPKDFSSYIHLTDPAHGQDRDVHIYMNSPLSYDGQTFYQASVGGEPGGPPTTTLQVVRNPGWMMPYLSCFMVAGGMLVHFGQNLYRFVDRFIERRAL